MRQVSKKRAAERTTRREVVAEALSRDGTACRARLLVPEVACRGPLDPHEIIPRSAWRAGYLVVSNVIGVCRAHHDWIGDHPDDAHALGLHGYSWNRPDAPGPTLDTTTVGG